MSVCDDGVTMSSSTTDYADDVVSPFQKTVERVMLPALDQLLQATGFAAGTILKARGGTSAGTWVSVWHRASGKGRAA